MALPSAPDLPQDHRGLLPSVPGEAAAPVATARELAAALGTYGVDDLQPAQPELAAALAQLSRAAGKPWPVRDDDPVVLLLRMLARVSIDSPDVTSTDAAALIARYTPAQM